MKYEEKSMKYEEKSKEILVAVRWINAGWEKEDLEKYSKRNIQRNIKEIFKEILKENQKKYWWPWGREMQGVRLGRGTFVPRTAPPLPHHPPLVTFSLLRILEGILECFKKYHDIKVIFEILEY